jgi:hypothetical protein
MMALSHLLQDMLVHPRLTTLMAQILSPWVTIFMLHRIAVPELGIAGTSSEYLRKCLAYLRKNNYALISVEEAIDLALERRLSHHKWVAFSVDDGFDEQVSLGSKIFAEFDCSASCFLITDLVDGKLWPWDYKLMYIAATASARTIQIEVEGKSHSIALGQADTQKFLLDFVRRVAPSSASALVKKIADTAEIDIPQEPPVNFRGATWNEVRAAEKLGMRFGPHSTSHHLLSSLDDTMLEREITVSTKRLEEECANPLRVFCYPSGKADEFDKRAFALMQKLNFKGALSAEEGFLSSQKIHRVANYRYAIPRLPLPHNFDEFKRYVSWAQYAREHLARSPLETLWQA